MRNGVGLAYRERLVKEKPAVGTKVRLTGTFLACTGQRTGSEGMSVWTVKACDCSLCDGGAHICTDEPNCHEFLRLYTAEELEKYPSLRWRHVAVANLMPVGGKAALKAEYFELPVVGVAPLSGHREARAR